MKKRFIVAGLLLGSLVLSAPGQTNSLPSSNSTPQPIGQVELKLAPGDISARTEASLPASDTNSLHSDLNAIADDTTATLESYFTRGDRFYLIAPDEPVPNTRIGRALAAIGEPEVVRLGKNKRLSCSAVTAVKRKNPLCLLNSTFLRVTW